MGKKSDQQKKPAKATGFWGVANSVKASLQQEKPVGFSFTAPDAYSVSVAGSFNQWTPGSFRLERESTGVWKGIFSLKPGIYEYRFFVNGQWVDDPGAKKTAANSFGTKNAILEVR